MSIRQMAGVMRPYGWRLYRYDSGRVGAYGLVAAGRRIFWFAIYFIAGFIGLNAAMLTASQAITMPGVSVGGQSVGLSSKASFITAAENTLNSPVSLPSGATMSLAELGVTVDAEASWNELHQIEDFWTLPLFKVITNSQTSQSLSYEAEERVLVEKLASMIEPEIVEPTPASLQLSPKNARVIPETVGYEVSAPSAAKQIMASLERGETEITISPRYSHSAVTASSLEAQAKTVQAALNQDGFTATYKGSPVSQLNKSDLLTLVKINKNGGLTYDRKGFDFWADEHLRPMVEKPAILAKGTRTNGKLTITQPGRDGLIIDNAVLFQNAQEALRAGTDSFAIPAVKDKAQVIVNGVYPKTDQGLRALIADYNTNNSADYWVVVEQLRGGDLSARYESHSPIIPASTYKAFLSIAALHQIEEGKLTLQTNVGPGTVEECMYIMVHHSTNICAHAIQNKIGAQRVDSILAKLGFGSTQLNNGATDGDKWTTAYDEYKLFRGLYEGTLLNEKHTNHILDLFKNQKYRSGIPAASAPDVVADKIGFLGYLTHDAGIVYGQDYDYALVIMTKGGSFWSINGLASQINQFFRQAS